MEDSRAAAPLRGVNYPVALNVIDAAGGKYRSETDVELLLASLFDWFTILS